MTGATAWLVGCATAPPVGVHPAPVAVAAGTVLAYAAGYGPDIDSRRSMLVDPSRAGSVAAGLPICSDRGAVLVRVIHLSDIPTVEVGVLIRETAIL